MDFLTPYAFITPEALQARLGRIEGDEGDGEARRRDAINALDGWFAKRTARRLRARNYRPSGTIVASAAADSTTCTTSSTASLVAGDEFRGVGVRPGSVVESITNATTFVLSRPTTAALSSVTCTYGSRALTVDGDGTNELQVPEYPIVEVFGIYALDGEGARTALDVTGARIEYRTGMVYLPNDTVPTGTRNIEIDCRAGYEHPDDGGEWESWSALEALSLRVGEIFYSDGNELRGRIQQSSMGSGSSSTVTEEMPADVEQAIARFVRLW